MIALDPDFVANAPTSAIRTQYEHAQRMADLWDDKARALLLLLTEREERTTR
ncbi:hypothetical protein OG601_47125 [Streptomyces sp. NBC_01239]|uniref:hypothetical protein n=1 Tax=Streptomyces sp. NBC_01239 TaxID=2903792 RepID=UPI00225A9F3B|nr:hypothetical protein [Streptomyces sp. NBC_01239]MCX4809034.1 hypothetical protein [Streptomyces sp. NBC_01239]MCX4818148.1 hypothetical protein [Streptomyces sp. NBC_01239]